MRALFAFACLLLAGVSGTPLPSPPPAPSPSASTSPGPSASASASPSPTPLATPTILMLAPEAPPQILWVNLSSTTPRAGDTVTVIVLTSSNVASVELRVGGYGGAMTKTDVGHFESTAQVPKLPLYMVHSFSLQVIARNSQGASVKQTVALHIR